METKFVEGLRVDKKEFATGEIIKLGILTDKFIESLKVNTNDKGYCNIDIKKSKYGNYYAVFNDFKPQSQQTKPEQRTNPIQTQQPSEEANDLPL